MNKYDFRKILVEMVKASGQEVIDRAEDLVGNGDTISDFDIWIRFSLNNGFIDGCPTIEITTRSHLFTNTFRVLYNTYNGGTDNGKHV